MGESCGKYHIPFVINACGSLGATIAAAIAARHLLRGVNLHGEWFSLVGPHAIRSFENVSVHTLFVGADGLDPEWGATSFDQDEAELLRAMAEHSRRRIAVVDHTKFGKVGSWRICKSQNLHAIVTDSGATEAQLEPFVDLGIEVFRV